MSKDKEFVASVTEELKENVDLFYQQKTVEALLQFDLVLERMAKLVDTLFSYNEEHEDFSLDENKIKETLTEAMNALEEKDLILLADILQYDFIEYIEELEEGME